MRPFNVLLAVVAATMLATGCSQQKQNATKVLEAVESSLAEIKDDAARYAPDGLKSVESQLERLNKSLERSTRSSWPSTPARSMRVTPSPPRSPSGNH